MSGLFDDPLPLPSEPVGTLLSQVRPEQVTWLWLSRIPLGKITVIDGDPGLGKSTLTLDIAARVSRGFPMPASTIAADPAGVVLLSAEDDLADTIRPRLDAADADVTRILALRTVPDDDGGDRLPSLPDDLDYVQAAIERVGAKLVIIDPLSAWLNGRIDSHKDADVRRALHRLAELAQNTGAAVVIVRHLNKASGGNALYRGGGSIGIIGAARSGLLVGRDPDDERRRVIASTKCNLALEPDSLSFHLEQHEGVSRVVWDGLSVHGAATILAQGDGDPSALDLAKDALSDLLLAGPLAATEVQRAMKDQGIAPRTMWRARKALNVRAHKEGMRGGWAWSLPESANTANESETGALGSLQDPWQPSGAEQTPF